MGAPRPPADPGFSGQGRRDDRRSGPARPRPGPGPRRGLYPETPRRSLSADRGFLDDRRGLPQTRARDDRPIPPEGGRRIWRGSLRYDRLRADVRNLPKGALRIGCACAYASLRSATPHRENYLVFVGTPEKMRAFFTHL